MKKKKENLIIQNKKAYHDYHIVEKYEAGIELLGTEVKSCRDHNISLADAFCRPLNNEIILSGVHISPYEHGNRFNHDPKRPRRLLLHKSEIRKLIQSVQIKGLTIVPLKFYIRHGRVKVEIGLAKGKVHADKRDSLRKKQHDMDARRAISKHR